MRSPSFVSESNFAELFFFILDHLQHEPEAAVNAEALSEKEDAYAYYS